MNARNALLGIIVLALLLAGCTSAPPAGNAPNGSGTITPSAANSFTTADGIKVMLKGASNADCDQNGGAQCTAFLLSTENPTETAASALDLNLVQVDASGKEVTGKHCLLLGEIDLNSNLMPGAKREGYRCFPDAGTDVKLFFTGGEEAGPTNSLAVSKSQIKALEKKIELTFDENYTYALEDYGYDACLAGVSGTASNTGTMPVHLKITQSFVQYIFSGEEADMALAVGESKPFYLGNVKQGVKDNIPTYRASSGSCPDGLAIGKDGGIAWINATDSYDNKPLASVGREVTACGYIYYDAGAGTYASMPCCAGGFCASGVCQDGKCVDCGREDKPCCEGDRCYDSIQMFTPNYECVDGTCVDK